MLLAFSNILLSEEVEVTWMVDLSPAYYKILQGDTLYDIQGTYDVYDVATSRSELKQLVLRRITDSYISDSIKNRRVEYFEKYISTIDGRATVRCVGLIKKLINLINKHSLIYRAC